MSHSIRTRWGNRASPFETDQKHAEEMWIESRAASSLTVSAFLSRDLRDLTECRTVEGKWRGNTVSFKCELVRKYQKKKLSSLIYISIRSLKKAT